MQGLALGLQSEAGATSSVMMDTMNAISRTAEAATAASSAFDLGASDLSFESTQNRKLEISVDVSSTDGTVSSENAQTIADAIREGLMLDRLEHMVGVA
jgi:hypothetical protein